MEPQDLDQSLVIYLDTEGWVDRNHKAQLVKVEAFIDSLKKWLVDLTSLRPDVFSTGDGAMVTLGRNCVLDEQAVRKALEFAIGFTCSTLEAGLLLRTVLSFGRHDYVLPLEVIGTNLADHVQVGGTINSAGRMMRFCASGEVMISDSVYRLMERFQLSKEWSFEKNDPFQLGGSRKLETWTYVPTEGQRLMYSPVSPEHPYKRFSSFPPISPATLRYFDENGLDFELKRVVEAAYNSMRHVNNTKSFVSWSKVLDVLTSLHYDSNDRVYVISRDDRSSNFWTQRRSRDYLKYLSRGANDPDGDGHINQVRVLVYDDDAESLPMADEKREVFEGLKGLHRKGTFFRAPKSRLVRYHLIEPLIFGFTLSERHGYAIISIPSPNETDVAMVHTAELGTHMAKYADYDQHDGPMKGFITADPEYVGELLKQVRELLSDTVTEIIK